jgi:Dolichyl-phosphate-mannose-protein mannosyltransferase
MNLGPETDEKLKTKVDANLRIPWIWLSLALPLTLYAFWGLNRVPFHPDESTQLYMSRDFEILFTDTLAMTWTPERAADLPTHYRLVDAPLTKYLLGIGRSIAGLPALSSDWDWSKTWSENQASGSLPDKHLLHVGRFSLALLLPFDLFFIYLIGKRIQGPLTGLLATLFLGLSALVLLHDRRAMAEAALTFGVLLSLWSFLDGDKRPWLVGLAVALTFSAKQMGAALLPVGVMAVLVPGENQDKPTRQKRSFDMIWKLIQLGFVFFLTVWILNPFLWSHPFLATKAAWTERQNLLQLQVADYKRLSPENALNSPTRRFAALLANLFFTPPAFAETANYTQETRTSEEAYLLVPGHNLLRGISGGGICLILSMVGIVLAIVGLRRKTTDQQRNLFLMLVATLLLGVGIYWFVPLPWQRYVLPLVPLICLWTAYALAAPFDRNK